MQPRGQSCWKNENLMMNSFITLYQGRNNENCITVLIIWLEKIERPKCELIIGLYKMLNYVLPRCSCKVHLLILSSRWQSKHFPGSRVWREIYGYLEEFLFTTAHANAPPPKKCTRDQVRTKWNNRNDNIVGQSKETEMRTFLIFQVITRIFTCKVISSRVSQQRNMR